VPLQLCAYFKYLFHIIPTDQKNSPFHPFNNITQPSTTPKQAGNQEELKDTPRSQLLKAERFSLPSATNDLQWATKTVYNVNQVVYSF